MEFSYYYYCNIKFNSEWNLYFVLICFTEFEYIVTPISLLVMNENNIIIKVNIMNSKLGFLFNNLSLLSYFKS